MSQSRSRPGIETCTLTVECTCICWSDEECPKAKAEGEMPKSAPLTPEYWCLAVGCDSLLIAEPEPRKKGLRSLIPAKDIW